MPLGAAAGLLCGGWGSGLPVAGFVSRLVGCVLLSRGSGLPVAGFVSRFVGCVLLSRGSGLPLFGP